MHEEWKTYRLEDLSERVCVGFVGTCRKYYRDKGIGVPMIRTTNLSPEGLDITNVQYIDLEFHGKQKKSQLRRGDILIARHGTNGQACLYDLDEEANCLNVVIVRPNQTITDYKWLLYSINSPEFRNQVDAHSTGSVQKVVNTTALAKFIIKTPSLQEQKVIASILSALDDKIELNLQMNKILEEMAMALYKHWFVDFGPFKDGKFVDSELGRIPEGWEASPFKDHLYIKGRIGWRGLSKSEYLLDGTGYAIINGTDFKNERINYSTCGRISEERFKESPEIQLKEKDILITKDGTIGKIAFVDQLDEPTSVASGIFVTRISSEVLSTYFTLMTFKSPYFKTLVKSKIEGSVIPHLYQRDFVEMLFPNPPSQIIQQYEEIVTPWLVKISKNYREIRTLNTIRDTLLPKLISGKVRVKDVQQHLAKVL